MNKTTLGFDSLVEQIQLIIIQHSTRSKGRVFIKHYSSRFAKVQFRLKTKKEHCWDETLLQPLKDTSFLSPHRFFNDNLKIHLFAKIRVIKWLYF